MHVGLKVAGFAALGAGAAVALAACTGRGAGKDDGPMADFAAGMMQQLQPSWKSGGLDVATQSVREIREGGTIRGRYDGTRLLQAADEHRFGTPAISDPAADVKGDGSATFNEVRHVARHFDVNADGVLQRAEQRSFEQEVGIRWLPA